jgi:RHS repeat-associated protein
LNKKVLKSKGSNDNSEFGENATDIVNYARTIIKAPTGVCAVYQDSGGVKAFYYIHTDYQGSWLAITNSSGTVTNRYSYDAWGRPRNVSDWLLKPIPITNALANLTLLQPRFDRGYTGHEMVCGFGLINMNGRLYDPYLQRFLSPDPTVQSPGNAQSYNRYSYCMNNPLMYTDPSGDFFVWDDYAIGFCKGLFTGKNPFKEGYKQSKNCVRIYAGLFNGSAKQILSRFTWELPQTMLGFGVALTYNTTGNVNSVSYYDGATVLQTNHNNLFLGKYGTGITLGSYIIGNNSIEADPNNPLFQHEYGHYLQSQAAGWAYIPRYAIPSLLGNNHFMGPDYNPVEQDANVRAIQYFNKKTNGNFEWYYKINKIGSSTCNWNSSTYNTEGFQDVLNSSKIKPKWYDYACWFGPLFIDSEFNAIYYSNHPIQ